MWHSYSIYTHDRSFFLEQLHLLKSFYPQSDFFFIQYLDPIGFHFRLRVKSTEIEGIEQSINTYFGQYRILKKIYDPEYSLFKEALPVYEKYSIELTEFSVKNRQIPPHYYIECFTRILLEHFNCDNRNFIESYLKYWEGYARFQNNKQKELLHHQLNKKKIIDSSIFSNVISTLDFLEKDRLNAELCFKFLHMTMNKLGFSIPDELNILSKYMENFSVIKQQ